ncbi:MAG: hypothetical protein AB7I36_17985 [Rhodospirillaceae bacterium]
MSSKFSRAPLPPEALDAFFKIKGFDDFDDTKAAATTQVRSLRRGTRRQRRFAERLARCHKKHRCDSTACPVCFRKFRRVTIGQIVTLLKSLGIRIYRVSLVSADWSTPLGQLGAETINGFSEAFSKALAASALKDAVIFGAWDFSVHVDKRSDDPPYYQPHLYLLVASAAPEKVVHATFSSLVTRSKDIPVPKRIGIPRYIWRAVNYSLKLKFKRRERRVGADGVMNTRYDKMRAAERRELAVVLHELGIKGRLFMRGIKRSHWTYNLISRFGSKNE